LTDIRNYTEVTMVKQVRSWSKPDNIPGLIGRKRVDLSVFRYGSHIPIQFHEDFAAANGGYWLKRGETRDIVLLLDGQEYNARLISKDRRDVKVDTLEINWGFNQTLKKLLEQRLMRTFQMVSQVSAANNDEDIIPEEETLSDDVSEYIDFYRTDTPFTYRMELITAPLFSSMVGLRDYFLDIMQGYVDARTTQPFGREASMRNTFARIDNLTSQINWLPPTVKVKWSVGQGSWARVPWVAFLDSRLTDTTQKSIYIVYLFREDMQGLYLALIQGVTDVVTQPGITQFEGRQLLRQRAESLRSNFGGLNEHDFNLDNNMNLHSDGLLAINYQYGTIAYRYYSQEDLPDDEALSRDLYQLLQAYQSYITTHESFAETQHTNPFVMKEKVTALIQWISSQGYIYEPWQIAAYIAALKTKPFVILAGVSGTGKSKLPYLVGQATGGVTHLLPVRPDWTDSSELLGYCDIQGKFRPAQVLQWAKEAESQPDKHHVCVMDEMNLARVEHYFAEVLSQIENRRKGDNGGYVSGKLISQSLLYEDREWGNQVLPANMAIVGTVNMDESTYGFSRKVLDRAFTIELSEINLARWQTVEGANIINTYQWPIEAWYPRAIRLSELESLTEEEIQIIEQVIEVLTDINSILQPAQLQLGYRSRDEIALFVLHAREMESSFVTQSGEKVDPLDLAILMKVLPRIMGGSSTIRQILMDLLAWANHGGPSSESDTEKIVNRWIDEKRPAVLRGASFPRIASRLCVMWERLSNEGFTSFWM
jgi:hypothetical protein